MRIPERWKLISYFPTASTPNSVVSFILLLAEFQGGGELSEFLSAFRFLCQNELTEFLSRGTHRVSSRTARVLPFETSVSRQYSARFLSFTHKNPVLSFFFQRKQGIRIPVEPLVAQCSATPAIVAATPPCSATPFQTQISVRHLLARGGGRCDTKSFRGCSATPVLHLQNAIKSRKSAATRVARHV